MLKFLGCLIQLIISPAKGWSDIAGQSPSPQRQGSPESSSNTLVTSGFYPLLGITACSAFIPRIYDKHLIMPVLIENAVVTFVSYFITYFLASALFAATIGRVSLEYASLDKSEITGDKRLNTFIIYNLSLLAIIQFIRNCLPMDLSLVQFMPLFALIVMWAGRKYLSVDEGSTISFMVLCGLFLLLPPYLISILFGMMIPG